MPRRNSHTDADSDQVVDTCPTCAGAQGPNHNHICRNCGYDAGAKALVVGDDSTEKVFYCSKFCIYDENPDHPLVSDVPAERWEVERVKREVQRDMRLLKQRAEKAGVAWT